MSIRHVTAGTSLGIGGFAAGHGPVWVISTVVAGILLSALAAAELSGPGPARRLWKLVRRR